MKRFGRLRVAVVAVLAAALSCAALVVPATPSAAVEAASLTQLKAQGIYYLRTGDADERQVVLGAMAAKSAWEGRLWSDFLQSWETINNGLVMNYSVPKGLPAKGHVFIVLGSALSKSGKMTTKLEHRMKVALAALRKYRHSKVLVSGGAPRKGHTEAEVMAKWLRAHKVPAARILIEKKSPSTVGNAAYSMAKLAGTSLTSYSLISGSSHLRRASILFLAATMKIQEDSGKAWSIRQLANVAYQDMASAGKKPLSASSIAYTASNVASVLKVMPTYKKVLADPPSTPRLTSVSLKAPAKLTYAVGEELDRNGMVVKAVYNKGVYTRLVTDAAKLSGFDTSTVGEATATATFTDDDVTKAASFGYSVVKATSSLSWNFSTKTIKRSKTRVTVTASVKAPNGLVPTGEVRYYLDGRLLKAVPLDDEAGPVSFTYPKIGTAGAHAFVVKYTGDDQLTAARSGVTLTVRG